MANVEINTQAELTRAIEASWSELEAFLSETTEDESNLRDEQGWTVADHVSHMAAWGDSVAILFEGRPRHEALGIDEADYLNASFDEINELIRRNRGEFSLQEAVVDLSRTHRNLLEHLANMTERELQEEVRTFFSAAANTDRNRVLDLVFANTANHYSEHLEWMRTLVGKTT